MNDLKDRLNTVVLEDIDLTKSIFKNFKKLPPRDKFMEILQHMDDQYYDDLVDSAVARFVKKMEETNNE